MARKRKPKPLTEEQIELKIKIEDLMHKRRESISEIRMLLHKFSKYYQNIDSMDLLGLLEPESSNTFGELKVVGLGISNMEELSCRFNEILGYETQIRELKTRSKL